MEPWVETDISFIKRELITLPSPKTDPQRNREITLPREGLVTKEWSADFPKMLRLFFLIPLQFILSTVDILTRVSSKWWITSWQQMTQLWNYNHHLFQKKKKALFNAWHHEWSSLLISLIGTSVCHPKGTGACLSLVCLTCLRPEVIIQHFQPVTFPIVCVVFYLGISTY